MIARQIGASGTSKLSELQLQDGFQVLRSKLEREQFTIKRLEVIGLHNSMPTKTLALNKKYL